MIRLLGVTVVSLPGAIETFACFAIYCANFVIAGVALNLIAAGVFDARGSSIALSAGVYAIAWVVGYITPGAPGGLGVREAILVAALAPIHGAETAFALALVLRLATVAADGLASLAGLALRYFGPH